MTSLVKIGQRCYIKSMSYDLKLLKELRERGATVQMQDDVANFVGGTDSSLFYPTVDFILTLQSASRQMEQEQSVGLDFEAFGIPKVYDPNFFEKVSIRASRDAVQNSALDDSLRMTMLNYLDNVEIQRADLLGVLGLEPDVIDSQMIYNPRGLNPARKPRGATNHLKSMFRGLIDGMRKLNLRVIANKDVQQSQVQNRESILAKVKNLMQRTAFRQSRLRRANRENAEDDSMEATLTGKRPNKKSAAGAAGDHEREHSEEKGQDGKSDGKPVEDVAQKHEQALEKFSGELSASALQAGEEKKHQEVGISKSINATKEAAKEVKHVQDKSKEPEKEQQKNLQRENVRRTTRLRVQQNVQQIRQKANQQKQSDSRVSEMSGEDAIKHLKRSGLKIDDTVSATKVSTSDHGHQKQSELQK